MGSAASAIAVATGLGALAYVAAAIFCVSSFRPASGAGPGLQPGVTVLKPICGRDAGLYENLRSFREQGYPEYQVVLGFLDPADPGIETARRVMADLPGRDIELIAGGRSIGPNHKTSNLANMAKAAKPGIFVIADSGGARAAGPGVEERIASPPEAVDSRKNRDARSPCRETAEPGGNFSGEKLFYPPEGRSVFIPPYFPFFPANAPKKMI